MVDTLTLRGNLEKFGQKNNFFIWQLSGLLAGTFEKLNPNTISPKSLAMSKMDKAAMRF